MNINPIFDFFNKLIDEFTWKRFILTMCIPCLFFLCIIAYENYTGTFRLNKIEKILNLIQQAEKLSPTIFQEGKPSITNAFKTISSEIEMFAKGTGTAFSIHPNILKGLAAFTPWLFLLLVFHLLGSEDIHRITGGLLIFAIIFSVIGAFLPSFQLSWINYLVYPIGHVVLIFTTIMTYQKYKRR